jgi:sulfur transfer protein SufE
MLHFRGKRGLDTPSAGASGYSTTFDFKSVRGLGFLYLFSQPCEGWFASTKRLHLQSFFAATGLEAAITFARLNGFCSSLCCPYYGK